MAISRTGGLRTTLRGANRPAPGASALQKTSASVANSKAALLAPKKKSKTKKRASKSRRARELVEEFGLCPISMEPMRRPVLPSSGMAYDEINLVRYCSNGKKRCPVSGATLKLTKSGKLASTPDFALRNVIRNQALAAKVYIPPLEKDELLLDIRSACRVESAKAVVDDTYLGYIQQRELRQLLDEFALDAEGKEGGLAGCHGAVLAALVAECLACRAPDIVALGVEFLSGCERVWGSMAVLQEALGVGQDPDCRGQVLKVIETKFVAKDYTAQQAQLVLTYETDSVPVQQFQARVAEIVMAVGVEELPSPPAAYRAVINTALRVREDLDGCVPGGPTPRHTFWYMAMAALRDGGLGLDEANLERLFWRESRAVLGHLAAHHADLLHWHLRLHDRSMQLLLSCVAWMCGNRGYLEDGGFADEDEEDEEEYLSDDVDDAVYQRDFSGGPRRGVPFHRFVHQAA